MQNTDFFDIDRLRPGLDTRGEGRRGNLKNGRPGPPPVLQLPGPVEHSAPQPG
jgi:hypothetical protein